MSSKMELRRKFFAARDELDEQHRKESDVLIARRLFFLPEVEKGAGPVSIYISIGSEAGTGIIIARLFKKGRRVAVPYLFEGGMEMSELKPETEFETGPMGIPQPAAARRKRLDPAGIGLFIVPGCAFDRSGARLGYGKGYYDAYLKELKGKVSLIGLAYSIQLAEKLPSDGHDVRMDVIVTEQEAIRVNG